MPVPRHSVRVPSVQLPVVADCAGVTELRVHGVSMTWRYEAVRPPYKVEHERKEQARKITAAALEDGLADKEFWDGEDSVRLVTWLHLAVAGGFLAIVLGVTARALSGSPHVMAVGWIAIGLGAATVVLEVAYLCLDAFDAMTDALRGRLPYLLVPAGVALVAAGLFAWLQPGGPAPRAAELPGMAGVVGWTALAIAVVVAIALISMLLGLPGSKGTTAWPPGSRMGRRHLRRNSFRRSNRRG
jgi:hypothetical protein